MKLSDIKIGSVIEILITRGGSEYKTNSKVEYCDERFTGVSPIASVHGLFRFTEEDIVDIIYHEGDRYWKWEHVKAGVARRRDGSRLHVFSSGAEGSAPEEFSEINERYEFLKNDKDQELNDMTPVSNLDSMFLMLDEQYEEIECKGYLKDLSEGGASVESDVKLSKGVFVSFKIDSEVGPVFLRGVILRVIEDKHGYFDYTYGVSFVETSKNYMRYFYLQQRKLLYENNDS